MPYVLLLVRACRQEMATFEQLHVLNWALRSTAGAEQLAAFLRGEVTVETPTVRYEPALDRAVALAAGLRLLNFDTKQWALTNAGRGVLEQVDAEDDVFRREKDLLRVVERPLSQAAVRRIVGRSADAA